MNRRNYWNKQAQEWGESYGRDVYDRLCRLFDSLDIKGGESVVDLGCGTGILFPHIAGRIGKEGTILGIDYSVEMLKKGRRKVPSAPESDSSVSLLLAAADARSLPVRKEAFDVITCFGAFAHFEEKQKSLSEMQRSLKPNGRTYIIHLLGREQLAEHHRRAGGPVGGDVIPDDQEMRRMLEAAGFINFEITDAATLYLARAEKPGECR